MPLGAFRINSLSKVLTTASADPRTTGFLNVIANGDAQLSNARYKFNTGTRGGSILFDGTGDYLQMDDNSDNNLDFGTGDFTIEWFQYLTSLDRFAIDFRNGSNGAKILLYSYPSDGSADDLYLWVNSANRISAMNVLSANQWQHIALVRESGTTSLYVDGTQSGGTYSDSNNYSHEELRIWHNSIGAENYTPPGNIDEFRISDTARYSGASITVPTSAFTQDVNTRLLLHGDGPYGSNGNFHIVDDIGDLRPLDIHIQTNTTGSTAPTLSSAQAKFGTTSLRLNDNDGHAEFAQPEWGDQFTIEFFFRADSIGGTQWMAGVWGGSGHGGFNWIVGLSGSNVKTYFFTTAGAYSLNNATIGTASANTWHHVAITWDGSTYRTFLDGTAGASVSDSNKPAFDQWQTTWVGTVGGTTDNFGGYIDEYRMSKTARYTSNFTPTSSAFADDSNTQVLLHFDGTNGDTTTVEGETPRQLSTWNNGSFTSTSNGVFNNALQLSANGSNGYIAFPSSFEFDDNVACTVEFRFKLSAGGTSNKTTKVFSTTGISNGNFPTSSNHLTLHTYSNGNLYFTHDGSETNLGNPGTSFHHIAMQYDGTGSFHLWLDGTHKVSATHSITTATELYFGNRRAGEGNNSGTINTIDEIRVSNTTRYAHSTSNITVPTSAFTNDSNTVALFHCESTTQTDDNS